MAWHSVMRDGATKGNSRRAQLSPQAFDAGAPSLTTASVCCEKPRCGTDEEFKHSLVMNIVVTDEGSPIVLCQTPKAHHWRVSKPEVEGLSSPFEDRFDNSQQQDLLRSTFSPAFEIVAHRCGR
jgi:hypothetical protein